MNIKIVTVLGANGTMGKNVAAIFASFGNAKVYMACRDIEKANKAVTSAYNSIRCESIKNNLIPVTYETLSDYISKSDLIFESISEDFEIKKSMYKRIDPYVRDNTILATGTSGLSISRLSSCFGKKSSNFYGIHMFNPPYNLTLCELVVHSESQTKQVSSLKKYLENELKRTVVCTKDTPSFLGNRIGFYFIGEAFKLAEENKDNGGIDYIDSILGCFTGRSMAPLITADFVGLDTTKSILDYIYQNTNDEFLNSFKSELYLNKLVNKKFLGKKTNKGLYFKDIDRKLTYVYDVKQEIYRLKNDYQFYFSNEMIKQIRVGNYDKAIDILINDNSHESLLCKQMLLKYITYSLKISLEVSFDIYACDDAMATGFNWIPPISLIELLGGYDIVKNLVDKYLGSPFSEILDNPKVKDSLYKKSSYDFRPFLKGKY